MSFLGRGSHGELNGFLDAGSHMEGDLHFEQNFRIEGRFTGTIRSEGDLVVGEKGEVEGEIRTGRVVVTGTVRGRIAVSRRAEIGPGGKVFGDIETPALIVDDGAFFEGRCQMTAKGEPSAQPAGKIVGAITPAAAPQPQSERRGKVS